jgi:hypothetical protein
LNFGIKAELILQQIIGKFLFSGCLGLGCGKLNLLKVVLYFWDLDIVSGDLIAIATEVTKSPSASDMNATQLARFRIDTARNIINFAEKE